MCIELTLTCINMTCIKTTLFLNDQTLEGCLKVFPWVSIYSFFPMFQGTKTSSYNKSEMQLMYKYTDQIVFSHC